MLTCKDVAARSTRYLERDLSWRDRIRYWAHLAACAACRRYVRQMRLTTEVLRLLGDANEPPAQLAPPLRDAFRHTRSATAERVD